MNIVLLGLNHKTAPIELRERLAIGPQQLEEATRSLMQAPGVLEGMILSTCNRVELLTSQEPDAPHLLDFIGNYFRIEPALLAPHIYEYRQEDAVRHLFRVACSLDSMVIGEPQILGQVKSSYLAARSAGAIRGHLDKVLQRAFVVAKRVRSETQIGSSSVSIASVAVELAKKIFGGLDDKKVLLVGAGKMSEQAARHLMDQGAGAVLVANRTHERAEQLAQRFGGRAIRFEEIYTTADQADIIITSTGSAQPIFRREHAHHFMQQRRGRPMFFIDIAVPRDVDPAVNKLDGIFLYDIDDLQSVAGSHLKERSKEAELAEAMIVAEVNKYQRRMHALNVTPQIVRVAAIGRADAPRGASPPGEPAADPLSGAAGHRGGADPRPGEQASPSAGAGDQGCRQRGKRRCCRCHPRGLRGFRAERGRRRGVRRYGGRVVDDTVIAAAFHKDRDPRDPNR